MRADLDTAAAQFAQPQGYLAAATMGLPPRATLDALRADLETWNMAACDPTLYDTTVANTRRDYARLVGIDASRVAIGSQTSVQAAVIAAAVPTGAEVLCVDGDFSSIVYPFLQRADIRVRSVALTALADSITDQTWLVAFSLVQSATGTVADAPAISQAAARHGTLTFCDLTQAAGVLPVDASAFDATVCHAYKWLCAPRGVSFLTVSSKTQEIVVATQAGWYAGDDPWTSCYGPEIHLAEDARRYDVSPAWQAWVGAEPSIALFAGLDVAAIWEHAAGLGDQLSAALRIPEFHQAIVTWGDPDGRALAQLKAAGIRASGRAGRLRVAFHLWNTEEDVSAVVSALAR
jgi:selenocysteine lyase/cysteine desulfurase